MAFYNICIANECAVLNVVFGFFCVIPYDKHKLTIYCNVHVWILYLRSGLDTYSMTWLNYNLIDDDVDGVVRNPVLLEQHHFLNESIIRINFIRSLNRHESSELKHAHTIWFEMTFLLCQNIVVPEWNGNKSDDHENGQCFGVHFWHLICFMSFFCSRIKRIMTLNS